MTQSRKVVAAFSASVLLHVILFTALALSPEAAQSQAPAGQEAEGEPLEMVIQMEPAESPKSPQPAAEPAPEAAMETAISAAAPLVVPLDAVSVKTELDPANLKKTDQPPENAEFLASHHSAGSRAKPKAASVPSPTPVPAIPKAPKPAPEAAAPAPGDDGTIALQAAAAPSEPAAAPPGAEGEEDGEGSVAAIGAWKKAVGNSIGSRWEFYRRSKLDLLAVGSVRIKFSIEAAGRVSDVRIVSNTATPANAMYAARAVSEAEIPPIPPERLAKVPGGRIEVEFTFTIFPNQ